MAGFLVSVLQVSPNGKGTNKLPAFFPYRVYRFPGGNDNGVTGEQHERRVFAIKSQIIVAE